jgi:sulfur-carrier protein
MPLHRLPLHGQDRVEKDQACVVRLHDVAESIQGEARYPMLRGTIRDHGTQRRRAFVRFFACEQDLSHAALDAPLPDAVVTGAEPLLIVGAMAGG